MFLNLLYYISVDESYGSIAQLGEHLPYKQRVIGSSPIVPTIISRQHKLIKVCGNGSVVERRLAKANVASSNLVSRSIFLYRVFSLMSGRHRQVVRLRSAKPSSPVQIWVAPPKKLCVTYRRAFKFNIRRCGGIGRRKGLKIPRSNIRAGSSPASGTTKIVRFYLAIFFLPLVFYKGFLSYKIFWEIAKFG